MSIPLALIGGLIGAGYMLNEKGKQPRQQDKVRTEIDKEEQPSDKNIYHSERFYDVWDDEFGRATKAHLKARDPVNENVVPRFYNDLGSRSEMTPEMKSYLLKRGSRLNKWEDDLQQKTFRLSPVETQSNSDRKFKFINESGSGREVEIEDSPMFQPLGYTTNDSSLETIQGSTTLEGFGNSKERENEMIEQFTVSNRSSVPNTDEVTKQEHFQSYTVHGPVNSNNPNYHNNMVPFYGSHITQSTDPMAHQTRLEYYTGQTNESTEFRSQPKREIPSLQDRTPGQTYIYGAPADNSYQRDRYITSTLKTNVLPFQQIRVGPGISKTYDDKPRDGFHSWYRCPQRNVDELRVNPKNVYEGRLLPGKEVVTNRGFCGNVYKRRPDTFYINDQRRWFKTTGSFTAPKIRENCVAYKQNREDTNIAYTGGAYNTENLGQRPGVYLEGSDMDTTGGAIMTVCDPCDPNGLAKSTECHGTLNARVRHTDRNQLAPTPFRNFGAGQVNKGEKRYYDAPRTTTRQTVAIKDYFGVIGAEGIRKSQKYPYQPARTTTRQTIAIKDYQGIAGTGSTNKNQKYPYQPARTTTRQTVAIKDYQGIAGTGSTNKNQKYFDDSARVSTRQTVAIKDYQGIAGTGSTNKNQKYFDDSARVSTRQTVAIKDYQGIAGAQSNLKNQKYFDDKARVTTRQTVAVKDYQGVVHSADISQPVSYESMYNATTNNNQESLLENRAYGPNGRQHATIGACDVNMQIKARTGYDITRWGPNENRQYQVSPSIEHNFSATTSQGQRDQAGVRQTEMFVVEQHERNPYSQSLQSAPGLTSPFRRGETPFNGCPEDALKDPRLLQ